MPPLAVGIEAYRAQFRFDNLRGAWLKLVVFSATYDLVLINLGHVRRRWESDTSRNSIFEKENQMSKRRQHPLITAMNRFDVLLASLDASNAEAFTAYVRNKVSTRRSVSPKKKRVGEVICGICGYEAEHANHDMTYSSSHPFATSGSAASAKRRSRRQPTSTTSTPNTEGDAANVMTASGN